MKHIERNPDIDLDREQIPAGMQLIEGKNLMHTARANKIPFGVASAINRITYNSRPETIGLIIRDHDVARFIAALAAKNSHKKGAAA